MRKLLATAAMSTLMVCLMPSVANAIPIPTAGGGCDIHGEGPNRSRGMVKADVTVSCDNETVNGVRLIPGTIVHVHVTVALHVDLNGDEEYELRDMDSYDVKKAGTYPTSHLSSGCKDLTPHDWEVTTVITMRFQDGREKVFNDAYGPVRLACG